MFDVAIDIPLGVWCCSGYSVGCFVLLSIFCWIFRVAFNILWAFMFLWIFLGMFDFALDILWDIWRCPGYSVGCLVLPWIFRGVFGGTVSVQ
jgi:hypothetical protein